MAGAPQPCSGARCRSAVYCTFSESFSRCKLWSNEVFCEEADDGSLLVRSSGASLHCELGWEFLEPPGEVSFVCIEEFGETGSGSVVER